MDTEDGSFVITGTCSSEDAQFDELVGTIEEYMVSFDLDATMNSLPSYAATRNEHEAHAVFRNFLQRVETELEQHVLQRQPHYKTIGEVSELLGRRKDEISEEVWDFVSEAYLDFVSFVEEWKEHSP